MAGATSALIALGGAALSGAQAIKSQKEMNTASQSIKNGFNALKTIKEANAFKKLQTPTLGFELAKERQAQLTTQLVNALQGTGAEGVLGGVGQVAQASNEQDLALSAQANLAEYQRNAAEAEAQQGINARQAERDFNIGATEVQGEQIRRYAAENRRNQAIQSAIGSLGSAALFASEDIPLYKENKLAAEKAAAIAGMPESLAPLGSDVTQAQLAQIKKSLTDQGLASNKLLGSNLESLSTLGGNVTQAQLDELSKALRSKGLSWNSPVGFGLESISPEYIKMLSSLKF